MTKAELAFLETINKIPPQKFAITSASDWPMLLIMGTAVLCLILYIWRDLKSDINSHRANSEKACSEYRSAIWEQINGPLWTAIAECCPRMTHEDLVALKEKIMGRMREHEDS